MSNMNLTIKLDCEWATDRFNNPNSALYFHLGYSQAPPGMYFDPATGGFTVMLWIKLISYNSWQRVIDFANGPGLDNCIFVFPSSTLQVDLRNSISGGLNSIGKFVSPTSL